MVMGFGKKRYYGGIKDENEAAKLYDKYAILTQGVGVSSFLKLIQYRLKQISAIQKGKCWIYLTRN